MCVFFTYSAFFCVNPMNFLLKIFVFHKNVVYL